MVHLRCSVGTITKAERASLTFHFVFNAVCQRTGELLDFLRVVPHPRQSLPHYFTNTTLHDSRLKPEIILRRADNEFKPPTTGKSSPSLMQDMKSTEIMLNGGSYYRTRTHRTSNMFLTLTVGRETVFHD